MIRKLTLQNFKAFEELELKLKNLSILAGCNSSGKSSLLQAIRLLEKQNTLEDFDGLHDFIRYDCSDFKISCEDQIGQIVEFSYLRIGEKLSNNKIEDLVSYLSADRYGPRSVLRFGINGEVDTVGEYGEKLLDFLYQLDTSYMELKVPDSLVINGGTGIRSNLQEWLRGISPGVEFDFSVEKNRNIGWTEFDKHKSIHAGFGLSYVLPLIISVLVHASQVKRDNSQQIILLVENPEAHLHPAGQTMMGRLLALGAACGLQIIVETHSDHLLNGIRIAVKEKMLEAMDATILYFKRNILETLVGGASYTSVEELHIDEYGMINDWPTGFFDETEKNLLKLL